MKRTQKKLKVRKVKSTSVKATKKIAKKPTRGKASIASKKIKQKPKVKTKTKTVAENNQKKKVAIAKKQKKTEGIVTRNNKSQKGSAIKPVGISKKPGRPKRKISQKFEAARKLMKAEVAIATTPVVAQAPNTPSPKVLRPFRDAAKENKKRLRDKEKARKRSHLFLAKPQKAGKPFKVDLRVHSPGTAGFFSMGGVETASALIRLSKVKGLDIVGITDYYNGIAIDDVKSVAADAGITVIPGVDLCCRVGLCEEVHLSALFPESFTSRDIFDLLEVLQVPTEMYGRPDYCLELPLETVLAAVESRQGVVIPSRLDLNPHRQLAIGPLVEEYGFHAFDVVYPDNLEPFRKWPEGQFTFFGFSNAYSLGQIGSRAGKIKLPEPSFNAIKELVKRRTGAEDLGVLSSSEL